MNKKNLTTWIEISQEALLHNVQQIKKLCPESQLGVVIKSNAYGHGMELVGSILEKSANVEWLFVVGIQEGLALRATGITKKILALAYHDAPLQEAIMNNIDITLYNADAAFIKELDASARLCGKKARVHIKVDTGLSRLGLNTQEVTSYAKLLIESSQHIELVGIFTHLADPNNPDPSYTHEQLDRFNAVLEDLKKNNIFVPVSHALSCGGLTLVRPPIVMQKNKYIYTAVRVGTNIYGMWKSDSQKKFTLACDPSVTLRPILTWKAHVLSVISVPAGQSIGYARTYTAPRDSSIAVISVGYFDGYPRALSGKSHVMINNMLAPVVGRISMNILAVDVTDIPNVAPHTEVILIGDAPGITADDLARQADTLNNEVLSRINPIIPRIKVP